MHCHLIPLPTTAVAENEDTQQMAEDGDNAHALWKARYGVNDDAKDIRQRWQPTSCGESGHGRFWLALQEHPVPQEEASLADKSQAYP